MASYTGLSTYRKCPRLYGFGLLGYKPIETPEPLMTGQFVHAATAAHFRGTDWLEAIQVAGQQVIVRLEKLDDSSKQAKALKELEASAKRAKELASRYIEHWAKDYTAPLVETELKLGNVVCHVDLIAHYAEPEEQRVIVDYKTSKSPDMRWYDVSGQVDLYAHVLSNTLPRFWVPPGYDDTIKLVIYDVISEEGIFRHIRPPRLEGGEKLFKSIQWLGISDKTVKAVNNYEKYLYEPHFAFDCPNRCQFWLPCFLHETADWSACQDYLEANYLK